jgi:hypothetical protein
MLVQKKSILYLPSPEERKIFKSLGKSHLEKKAFISFVVDNLFDRNT